MLKLTGAVMIITSGSILGILQANKLKKRADSLETIISALALLKCDINYGRKDLQKAMRDLGKNLKADFFGRVADYMGDKGVKEAIKKALEEENECFLKSDKEPIRALGEVLGMTDAKNQSRAIDEAVIRLKKAKEDADENYKRLGKMYKSTGFLGGVLVAIVLM